MERTTTLIFSILEFIFCMIGIAAQIVVCWTILKYRKSTFANTFYILVVALAIPDTIHLATEVLCALPAMFHGIETVPKLFLYTCGFFADASFWALSPLMLVIAVNRYIAVCHFEAYKRCFTRKRVAALIVGCFAISLIIPTIMYACRCFYDFTRFAWLFDCQPNECTQHALDMNAVVANSICGGVIVVYILICIQYRRITNRVGAALNMTEDDRRRRAKEAKLMFQFATICGVLVGYQVFYWIFLKAWTNEPSQMVLNFIANLNSCISPFLYLAFGSEIRSRLPWRKQQQQQETTRGGGHQTFTRTQSIQMTRIGTVAMIVDCKEEDY